MSNQPNIIKVVQGQLKEYFRTFSMLTDEKVPVTDQRCGRKFLFNAPKGEPKYISVDKVMARDKDHVEYICLIWEQRENGWAIDDGLILSSEQIDTMCEEIPPLTRLILFGESN